MQKATTVRKKQSFLHGAIILTIAMFIVKLMGALYKIPLSRILGPVGNSYFNIAYNIYAPLEAVSTAGLPIAISKLVSENMEKKRFRNVRRIHSVSIPMFLITGLMGMMAMFLIAPIYSNFDESSQAKFAVWAMAPTVLFVCLMSIYRGYYQGLRNMIPTALSEIIESTIRLSLGLVMSYLVVSYGLKEYSLNGTVFGVPYQSVESARNATLPLAAAGAIFGVTIGAFCSFLFLLIRYKIKGDGITKEELLYDSNQDSTKYIFKKLIYTAFPIALGAIIMNLASLIDSTVVLRRLYGIMDKNPDELIVYYGGLISNTVILEGTVHNFLQGCFGYASNMMMIIPAITQVFGISALPSVSEAWISQDYVKIKQNIESVLRITMLVTIPAGLGLVALSYPIIDLVYGGKNTQSAVFIASNVLTILGISAIFISSSTPICSMLQAIGRVDLPVKLLSFGVIIKVVVNYLLVGIPQINIQGAGVGTLMCYMFVTISALYFLCKETRVVPDFNSVFIKPLLAGICSSISAYVSHGLLCHVLLSKISTLCAVGVAIVVYVMALFVFKAFTADDIKLIPGMEKILKRLEKRHRID